MARPIHLVKDNPPRKQKLITVSCQDKDAELIEWLKEYLGTSRSEAVRTAVRHFAAHIGHLERARAS